MLHAIIWPRQWDPVLARAGETARNQLLSLAGESTMLQQTWLGSSPGAADRIVIITGADQARPRGSAP